MSQAARPPAPTSPARRAADRARIEAALVSAALFGANALSYLLNMVAARALVPDVYGALGSLLAIVVVGAVPAMGMQAVAALNIAGASRSAPSAGSAAVEAQLLRTGLGGAALVGLAAIAATPLLVALLHLPSGWPVVWLGLALAPLTLLGVFHGILQGHQRFGVLAFLVGAEGVAKVGGSLAGLLLLKSTTGTLAGMAIGSALTAVVGWWVCGRRSPRRVPPAPDPAAALDPVVTPGSLARDVFHASQAILGLVLLVNLDIVLARHHLSGAQAGDYAIGAIITKIAYWLPQAVAVIVLPRFADERNRRKVVPIALGVIALLDVWVVLGTILYGDTIIRLIGGDGYGSHVGAAWLFALLGSCLALVQLLLYSRIASTDRRSATAVWAAVILEVILVSAWFGGTVAEVAGAALASVGLLVAAGLLIE